MRAQGRPSGPVGGGGRQPPAPSEARLPGCGFRVAEVRPEGTEVDASSGEGEAPNEDRAEGPVAMQPAQPGSRACAAPPQGPLGPLEPPTAARRHRTAGRQGVQPWQSRGSGPSRRRIAAPVTVHDGRCVGPVIPNKFLRIIVPAIVTLVHPSIYEASYEAMNEDDEKKPRRPPPRPSDYLKGDSPLKRSQDKIERVLVWIYLHGVSTAEIIRQVSGQKARGYAKRLVKAGLLVETPTEGGGFVRGVPVYYYTLSPVGLQVAERHAQVQIPYPEIDSRRVDQSKLRHSIIIQEATWFQVDFELIKDHRTERMVGVGGDKANIKRPDAVWTETDLSRTAIEVELSGKYDRDLDDFIHKLIEGLYYDGIGTGRYGQFFIISDQPKLLARYKSAMQPGAPLAVWAKSSRNRWEKHRTEEVPHWLCKQVYFHLYPDFLPTKRG